MNTNWAKWVVASVIKYFSDNISFDVFIEGMDRETSKLSDFAEIRVDGPKFNELSKNYWKIRIEVNILIHSVMSDTDLYHFYDNIGIVNKAFQNCISVYKRGNNVEDDNSHVGCLKLVIDRYDRENIVTSNFGQIDKSVKLQQATVEAHYEMYLNV